MPIYCPTQAQATTGNGTQHLGGEFTDVLADDCTGEWVDFDVLFKTDVHVTTDSAGGLHANLHDVFLASGIGESSGLEYVATQADSTTVSIKVGQVTTTVFRFSLISKGAESNLEVRALRHVTINAKGEVTASIDNLSIICR